jgi:hypothetical protein
VGEKATACQCTFQHWWLHQLEQSDHIHPNLGIPDSGSKGHCWPCPHEDRPYLIYIPRTTEDTIF